MKANAIEAGKIAGTKFLAIRRPPWVQREGDRWIMVESLEAAAAAIGKDPRRVFLTTGRMELAPFRAAPQHLLYCAQRRGALACTSCRRMSS